MIKHFELFIPTPSFSDDIVNDIIRLEQLRGRNVNSNVHPKLFRQLKQIFHIIESLASARIEGNHTTIVDYVQDQIEQKATSEPHKEIEAINKCILYIDRCYSQNPQQPITEEFLKTLHRLLVKDLNPNKEGCKTPGTYRNQEVTITRSEHIPPLCIKISDYMSELIAFINFDTSIQQELLKVAVAHYRFTWIHPFSNGNGRISRLLTYAMLQKYGFDKVALLNPAAIFCMNRDKYFAALSKADTGTEDGMLFWCRYVLAGLNSELKKIEKLLDRNFLIEKIIKPSIEYSLSKGLITPDESKIVEFGLYNPEFIFMSKDITKIFGSKQPRQITYFITKMLQKGLLKKESPTSRKYYINILYNPILRGFVETLTKEGFLNFENDNSYFK